MRRYAVEPRVDRRWSTGSENTKYLTADHLNSSSVLMDSSGNTLVGMSFAAYGRRRGATWTGAPSSGDWTQINNATRHGYTGHEHLDNVNLIHMNGRVFEPVLGRFLSADPFIDGIGTSQGPNRYAYVHANPLAMIDPSGHCGALPGMNDEEASDYISQCSAAFESAGWGPAGEGQSQWCSQLGIGCRDALGRYYSSEFAPLHPDNQRALQRHNHMVATTTFHRILETRLAERTLDRPYGVGLECATAVNLSCNAAEWVPQMSTDTNRSDASLDPSELAHIVERSLHSAGTLGHGAGYYWVRDGQWRGLNGEMYRLGWGGNEATGARKLAVEAAKAFKTAGKGLGYLGAGVSGVLAIDAAANNDWAQAGLHAVDTVMGVVMVTSGPGFVVGAVYFTGRYVYGALGD